MTNDSDHGRCLHEKLLQRDFADGPCYLDGLIYECSVCGNGLYVSFKKIAEYAKDRFEPPKSNGGLDYYSLECLSPKNSDDDSSLRLFLDWLGVGIYNKILKTEIDA